MNGPSGPTHVLHLFTGQDGDDLDPMKCSPSHASLHDFGEAGIGHTKGSADNQGVDATTDHNDFNTTVTDSTTTHATTTHGLKATEVMAQSIPVQVFDKDGSKATEVKVQGISVQGFGKVTGGKIPHGNGQHISNKFSGTSRGGSQTL